MSQTTARPLQPGHAERLARLRRHFIEVVEPLLEAGAAYADLSVERLIQAADISRSTFYVYFDDKGDLLGAMVVDITADLAEAGASWFEFAPDGTRDDLREALRPLFDTYRRHKTILGAVSEAAAYDARVREQHGLLVERAVSELSAHIAGQQRLGAAAPELHARRTAQWLVWMLERGFYQLVAAAEPAAAEDLLDTMTDIAWRTLYAGFRRRPGR
jgi:TetR/AcrR family transcriptional regulator, ethionamide resistance regulator